MQPVAQQAEYHKGADVLAPSSTSTVASLMAPYASTNALNMQVTASPIAVLSWLRDGVGRHQQTQLNNYPTQRSDNDERRRKRRPTLGMQMGKTLNSKKPPHKKYGKTRVKIYFDGQ